MLVSPEPNARAALELLLSAEGYETAGAANGEEALEMIERYAPAAVLSDVKMPRMDGMTLLAQAKASRSDAVFVMMTGFATVELAVAAMHAGAESYLVKPLDLSTVSIVLRKALEKRASMRETVLLRERVGKRFQFRSIVGDSPPLRAVFDLVRRAAPTKATVLILGESGTGKELIAQALHQESPRKDKPFIKVSCAALSKTIRPSNVESLESRPSTDNQVVAYAKKYFSPVGQRS